MLPAEAKDTSTPATDAVNAPAKKPAVKPSKAEAMYDWMIYDGLINWTNLGVSLYVADSLMHGWAKPVLEKSINSTSKLLASTSLVSEKAAFKTVKPAMRTLSLTVGGWMLLAPMKWLEDNKRENVHWMQENFYGGAKDEHGNPITPEQMCLASEPPKQSWWNVIKRRLLVTGLVTPAAGVLLDHTIGEHNVTSFVVDHTNKALKSGFVPYGQQIAQREAFQRYLSLAALDTFYCYITKQGMYYTNGTHGQSLLGSILEVTPEQADHTASRNNQENCRPQISMAEKITAKRQQDAEQTSALGI